MAGFLFLYTIGLVKANQQHPWESLVIVGILISTAFFVV
jgi:hypothetical protein